MVYCFAFTLQPYPHEFAPAYYDVRIDWNMPGVPPIGSSEPERVKGVFRRIPCVRNLD